MPALPGWYARIPDILQALESAPPFLDRPAFEHLFQVSRRQAIRLMAHSGGYQVGKTFLVDREALVRQLGRLRDTPSAQRAVQRKQRILNHLREVSIPAPPVARKFEDVSCPGVSRLAPGRLEISYSSAADLLGKIALLASSAADDFPRFRETFE